MPDVKQALEIAASYGTIDGNHHKMWVIDQMVRALTNCPRVMRQAKDVRGKDYSYETYGTSRAYDKFLLACEGEWDEGIAP